jgi:hypothetical protein
VFLDDCWIPTRFVFGIWAARGVLGTLATFHEHMSLLKHGLLVEYQHRPITYGPAFLDAIYTDPLDFQSGRLTQCAMLDLKRSNFDLLKYD